MCEILAEPLGVLILSENVEYLMAKGTAMLDLVLLLGNNSSSNLLFDVYNSCL